MPVPQRVIEAKVESPRTKPDADKGWLRRFLDGFRGGNGQTAELVSPPQLLGCPEKLQLDVPFFRLSMGSDGPPMNTLTISIDADVPKRLRCHHLIPKAIARMKILTVDVIPGHTYRYFQALIQIETVGIASWRDAVVRFTDFWEGARRRMTVRSSMRLRAW